MMTRDENPPVGPPAGRSGRLPRVFVTAIWLGLVIGIAELGMLLLWRHLNHAATIGSLRLNRHYPWMVPASNVLIFGACGAVLEIVARAWPRVGTKVATYLLA